MATTQILSNYSPLNNTNWEVALIPVDTTVVHTLATQALENQSAPAISNKREIAPTSDTEPQANKRRATSAKVDSVGPTTLQTQSDPFMTYFAFQSLNTDPYLLYLTINNPSFQCPDLLSHGLEDLDICGCEKLPATARLFLEEQILELLDRSHSKNSLLTIVTVGAGDCYQELVYLAKCANAGYRRIQLVLIDKEPVPRAALTEACRTYLSPTDINIAYYPSLESYHSVAATRNHLKPNLLLLLDITDEEYEIDGTQLPEHCFQFFNQNNLFKDNTVIAHSDALADIDNNLFSIVACGIQDGTAQDLPSIADRRERMMQVNEDFPAVLQ